MTNEQFQAWRKLNFRSKSACAKALGINRETVDSLERGATRNGTPYPVSTHLALACAAWTMGIREYHGGAVTWHGAAGAA